MSIRSSGWNRDDWFKIGPEVWTAWPKQADVNTVAGAYTLSKYAIDAVIRVLVTKMSRRPTRLDASRSVDDVTESMRFSLSVLPFFDPDDRVPFRRTFDLCARAEELGYDTVMIGHHHFLNGQISDPFTLLAAIAARTERIRIATAIFLLPLHHPLQVAERVATLDQLSGGRMSFGVGSGWNPREYAAFGATLSERGARMDESLALLDSVLIGCAIPSRPSTA